MVEKICVEFHENEIKALYLYLEKIIQNMKKRTLLLSLLVLGINCSAQISEKISKGFHNPIIDHTFTADPTAVEHEGRIYVYGTNDHEQYLNAEKNGYEKIKTLQLPLKVSDLSREML